MSRTSILFLLGAICVVGSTLQLSGAEESGFECLGPSGGGSMYGPAISPHDSNLMLVSCDMGGFYVSEDGGKQWRCCMLNNMQGSQSHAPAFHPKDPKIVYMPWGERICVSKDKGHHWEVISEGHKWLAKAPPKLSMFALNIDPDDANLWFVPAADGLYRSVDGAKTFQKCDLDSSTFWVHISPASPKDARFCVAGGEKGVFVSKDSGKTWTKEGKGLTEPLVNFRAGTDMQTKTVSCYALSEKNVFCSHDNGETFTAVEKLPPVTKGALTETDGLPPATFRRMAMADTVPNTVYVTDWPGYAYSWGVWKTADGGKTWKKVMRPYDREKGGGNIRWGWIYYEFCEAWGGAAKGFNVNPKNPDELIYSNCGEVFISQNGGKTWEQRHCTYCGKNDPPQKGDPWAGNGLGVAGVRVTINPHDNNVLFAAFGDIGLHVSKDRGKTWRCQMAGIPPEWHNTIADINFDPDGKVVYAFARRQHGGVNGGFSEGRWAPDPGGSVVKSADGGETWKVLAKGLPSKTAAPTALVCDFKTDPKNPALYVSYYGKGDDRGVYKSTDGGETWIRKSKGIGRAGQDEMQCCALALQSDGALYCTVAGKLTAPKAYWDGFMSAFASPGGLWKSTDGAETWVEVTNAETPIWWPNGRAVVDPKNPKRILLAECSTRDKKSTGGVWETLDEGKTWHKLVKPDDFKTSTADCGLLTLSDADLDCMILKVGCVYTTSNWLSQDGGKSWKPLAIKGFPPNPAQIVFDPKDPDTIYANGNCTSLWRGPASAIGR
jgi:photosystem II stability/assembly factor-like uncharacterized protein